MPAHDPKLDPTPSPLLVPGFRFAAGMAGIKTAGRLDVALIVADAPAAAAGVFTKNRVKAAPVLISQRRLRAGKAQAVIINSGNANACSGEAGMAAARATTKAVAKHLGCPESLVLPASTGVIGQVLPADKIAARVPDLTADLSPEGLPDVARAIMTTDTFPKTALVRGEIGGAPVTLAGIAKGAGMIHPDMATLLAFICTDAAVSPWVLKEALLQGLPHSFNRISVDGDTSTNDTLLVLASGAAGNPFLNHPAQAEAEAFTHLLTRVMAQLADQVVADGEGARHVYKVVVQGAASAADALKAARTVALSPLVKTAVTGNDANWGRIMAALGRSGARLDPARVDIFFGPHQVVNHGLGVGPEAEAAARGLMQAGPFELLINLNLGEDQDYCLTCDLTADYVKINADYRT